MFKLLITQVLIGIILLNEVFGQQKYFNRPSQQNQNQQNLNRPNKPQSQQRAQTSDSNVNCPERNIRLETGDCNQYIECIDGVGTLKTCPDGLFYQTNASFFIDPCSYMIMVDCGSRKVPPSTSVSNSCPYENGYFLPEPDRCDRYVVCTHGTPHNFNCPMGLAFDLKSYTCRWPDEVENCDSSKYLGVTCPPVGDIRSAHNPGFEAYPYEDDCTKFYICIRNSPRILTCPDNQLFNSNIGQCDAAENVTCGSGVSAAYSSNVKPAFNQKPYNSPAAKPTFTQKPYNSPAAKPTFTQKPYNSPAAKPTFTQKPYNSPPPRASFNQNANKKPYNNVQASPKYQQKSVSPQGKRYRRLVKKIIKKGKRNTLVSN